MSTLARWLLRLVTLVLAVALVTLILVGGFWYVWQDAYRRMPAIRYTVTVQTLERGLLGLYLRYRGAEVEQPVAPYDSREITFVVEPGDSVGMVARRLQQMGLISDAELFRRVVQYRGADGDLQAGVYALRPNMTMAEILYQLQHGRVATTTVTIPEGWRAEEIAEHLEALDIVSAEAFMHIVREGREGYDFLADRPEGSPTGLEGFLFPDTYHFSREISAEEIIDLMLATWDQRVSAELRERAAEQGLSLYEVVILASIVEREAVVAEERPLIAGVYRNRLEIGMPLQADPTVQYAQGYHQDTGRWWKPLTVEDTRSVISPYNTYLNAGLPPGPICNPGLSSIKAVIEPVETDYLFFLHKGDGSHVFSTTFEEHLRNLQLYGQR